MNCLDTVESGSHVAAGSADMTIKVTDTSRSIARHLGSGYLRLARSGSCILKSRPGYNLKQ